MKNEQKTRIEVEIEFRHRGSAPLHLNKEKRRGVAVVEAGPKGVKKITSRWLTTGARFSLWGKQKNENEAPLLNDTDALTLVNPAGMMEAFLSEATLLSDEKVTWQGQPARLLVIRPAMLDEKAAASNEETEPKPYTIAAKVWLDENGVPLAMERDFELRFGPALSVTGGQSLTFQQVEGRLLVAEAEETYSGTGLAVLHGRDDRKLKVVAVN
ncbi:MAG: hypothetical protein QOH06_1729 [Acidobacteriota bacterium]|nr:hypothetical protein [Acidobacteriota bacterium]